MESLPASSAPERVALILSDRIKSGVYRAGDPLPAERVLAADLNAHRRSIRIAIDQLVQSGLVVHRPYCRPTVGPSRDPAEEVTNPKTATGTSSSRFIALILCCGGAPLANVGSSERRIFWGMTEALMKFGYHAVFLNWGELGSEDENAANEANHLNYIREQGFGGALFYPYAYRRNHDLLREVNRSVPIVLLDRKLPGAEMDFVGVQNLAGMSEVTAHLIAQGHRRIAYVTRREPINSVLDRVQGYSDAMWRNGPAGMLEMILTIPHYRDDRAWTVVDSVFRLPKDQRPTAAVCFTDDMAVILSKRLEYLGLEIPGDVAVTGFDDIVSVLPNGKGLTTVAQPFEEVGSRAVELLMRRVNDRNAPPVSLELPVQ